MVVKKKEEEKGGQVFQDQNTTSQMSIIGEVASDP